MEKSEQKSLHKAIASLDNGACCDHSHTLARRHGGRGGRDGETWVTFARHNSARIPIEELISVYLAELLRRDPQATLNYINTVTFYKDRDENPLPIIKEETITLERKGRNDSFTLFNSAPVTPSRRLYDYLKPKVDEKLNTPEKKNPKRNSETTQQSPNVKRLRSGNIF